MSETSTGAGATVDRFRTNPAVWRAVGLGAGIGTLLGLATVLLQITDDIGLSQPLAVGVPAAVGALLQLLRATFHQMLPVEQAFQYLPTESGTSYYGLRQLERRLASANADAEKFDWGLRPMLAQLARDRLRYKHAIIIGREPDRARELLGEQLWQLMKGPPPNERPSAPTREQITALIAAIEAL